MIQKFLILMIVGYSSILMVKSELHVDCNFRNQEIWNYNVYTCEASISKFGSGNQVTRVTGNHLSGKNDDDVQAISILDQNLEEFPSDFENVFKYIRVIRMQRNGLEQVTQNDLSVFEHLEQISFTGNVIHVIDWTLFLESKNLKHISFANNRIRHVSQRAFDDLNQLESLDFTENTCVDMYAQNVTEMEDLMWEFSRNCPLTTNMIEEEILNGSEFKLKVGEVVNEILAANPPTTDLSGVNNAITQHETRLDAVESNIGNLAPSSEITRIEGRIDDHDQRITGVDGRVSSLTSRVDVLETP